MNETPRLRSAFPGTPRPSPRWQSTNRTPRRSSQSPNGPSSAPRRSSASNPEKAAGGSASKYTPLIPLDVIDAPTQRRYVVSLYVILWAWRLYDFWHIQDDLDSTWQFLKWIGIDASFFVAVPALQIPWLQWNFWTVLAFWLIHVVWDALLMFQISLPVGFLLGALVKKFYDREAGLSSDSVDPRGIRSNSSIILGKQIIQILPEGSAVLNPDRIPLCLNATTTSVDIPIRINQTSPILIELLRTDLETFESETITINAKQARQMKKQADKGHHRSDNGTPRTLRYAVSKTGFYQLQRVVDESNFDVRGRNVDTAVVACPQASVRTVNQQRCIGELSNIAIEVTGVPPFKVRYSKRINHQQFSSIVQNIQPLDHESPLGNEQLSGVLTDPAKPYLAWTRSATVSIDINEALNKNGSWSYSIEEVEDGFGNLVSYHTDLDIKPSSSQRQSLLVHNRPRVQLVGCEGDGYLRVAEGKILNLPVRLRPAGQLASQDWPLKLTYSFVPEGVDDSAAATRQLFDMKDDRSAPQVSKAGKYIVELIESQFCRGEVDESSSCILYNPPRPELAVESEDIIDKCAGNPIGLIVNLDFTGTPPFNVRYLAMDSKGNKEARQAKFDAMRGQIELRENAAGRHSYQFLEVKDAVYGSVSLLDKSLTLQQDIRPSASAFFTIKTGSLKACLGERVALDVRLTGEGPWTLDYEIVRGGNRKKYSVHSESDLYTILVPEATEGGTQSIVLTGVQDVSKCRTAIQQERTIEVRMEKPQASFGELDGQRSLLSLEGKSVKLPLRLRGIAPWAVQIANLDRPSEPASQHMLKDANAMISVDRPGTYEIQSVHDSCPGVINPAANTFKVSWVERPNLAVNDDRMESLGEREYRKPAVCQNDEDAFTLNLSGNPPYHVKYSQKSDPLKGSMAISSKSISLANDLASIAMESSRAGEYTYTFNELSDDRYSYDKKAFRPLVIRQQVYPLPLAKFANPGKTFGICKDDSGAPEQIPISLEGVPPFAVEIGIMHHGTIKPEIVRIKDILSTSFSWSLSRHNLGLGTHAVHLLSVKDSRGCENIFEKDPSTVRIMVSDPPTIFPLESRVDYCVGDHVSYSLSGQPSFEVFYEFRDKERKAKVPTTDFRRLAEAPGEFKITAVGDSASGRCRAKKELTKIIHPMPSVKISRGRIAVADIHEGGEVEILFEFTGTPPFEFTYTRSENSKRGKRGPVLETRNDKSFEFSKTIMASDEGTYEVVSIKDRYCSYTTPQAGEKAGKATEASNDARYVMKYTQSETHSEAKAQPERIGRLGPNTDFDLLGKPFAPGGDYHRRILIFRVSSCMSPGHAHNPAVSLVYGYSYPLERFDARLLRRSLSDRMTSPQPHILNLPDEILLSAIAFVTDCEDLCSLVCVNRRFNDLAEPFLYNTINVVHGHEATALTRAITSKRVRATWIRSLLVSTRFCDDSGLHSIPPQISLMRNLRDLRLETPDCNAKPPNERIPWINLQERYERIFESSSILVPEAMRLLPRLQSCILHFVDDDKEIYSLGRYAMLFLHPTLRSLTISCASTDFADKLLTPFQSDPRLEKQTGLEYLHLEECDIYEPSLAILLSFPKSLKAFKLSEGVRYSPVGGFHPRKHGDVDPDKFVKALAKHCQNSLEWLSLSLGYVNMQHHSINQRGHHLDLTRFHNIKHLELDIRTTFLIIPPVDCDHGLWRRLPPKLESLKIFDISVGDGLGDDPPFTFLNREYWPFEDCVIQEKTRHGLQHLKTLTYSYCTTTHETDAVIDEVGSDNEFEVGVTAYRRIKGSLIAAAATGFPMHKKAGISLKVVLVSNPRGFIPPYLNGEDSPVEENVWDPPISWRRERPSSEENLQGPSPLV